MLQDDDGSGYRLNLITVNLSKKSQNRTLNVNYWPKCHHLNSSENARCKFESFTQEKLDNRRTKNLIIDIQQWSREYHKHFYFDPVKKHNLWGISCNKSLKMLQNIKTAVKYWFHINDFIFPPELLMIS